MSFADDYYANYGGMAVADYVERHIRGSASEMDRMRRTVGLVPPDVASVLDVGAGHGVFLEELKAARGVTGTGIEITPAKVDYAQSRGIDLRLGDAARLDFADRAFDAVVSCEVLEHLPFGVYEAALAEFGRVARRWVIVTVPYDERRRFVRCPYCHACVNPDYHFRAFAPGSMAALAPALGPGFALRRELALGARRRSALVEWARRLIDSWPRFLVCPACGYRAPDAAGPPASPAIPVGTEGTGLARRLATLVPASERPIWLVGVFERVDGAAGAGHA